jgi:hypothetical protein
MITLPPKTHIWIAAGVTDLRRGFDGLGGLVQTKLEQSPVAEDGPSAWKVESILGDCRTAAKLH